MGDGDDFRQRPVLLGANFDQDRTAEAFEKPKETQLTAIVDNLTSTFVSSKETRDEVNTYTAQGLKTACLFARGRLSVVGAAAFSGLDQINPQDNLQTKIFDGALGGAKGALTKGVFSVVGGSKIDIGVKAFALGSASRSLDASFTRQNYQDGVVPGIKNALATTFDKRAICTDLLTAGAATALIGGANLGFNNAIARSPFLTHTLTGTSFGLVSGASNEVIRQEQQGEEFNWQKVAFRGATQGGVDTLAAMISGRQRPQMLKQPATMMVVETTAKPVVAGEPPIVRTATPPVERVAEQPLEKAPVALTEMFTPFIRLSEEPVLAPRPGKFDSAGAFNPAAVKLPDGRIVLLYRAQDDKGVSTVGYAESKDGIHFTRFDEPIMKPRFADEKNGIEDPRVTPSLAHPGAWDMTATAYNTEARLTLYRSYNLKDWDRVGFMLPPARASDAWNVHWTKSGAIVPEKINGKYWMYYMGDAAAQAKMHPDGQKDQTGIAWSSDGIQWRDAVDGPILARRPGKFDSHVVEPGPAPIITKDGILLLYNGANANLEYRIGWALFDKTDPTRLLARSDQSIYEPQMSWEKKVASATVRQAPNVVFAEGLIPHGDGFLLYYGAADSYVGVLKTSLRPTIPTGTDAPK